MLWREYRNSFRLTRAARLWLWAVLLSACVLGASVRAWLNHHRYVALQNWLTTNRQIDQLEKQAVERVSALFRGPKTYSREELEAALNQGSTAVPLRSVPGQEDVFIWQDPISGQGFQFDLGPRGLWRTADSRPRPPQPQPGHLDRIMEGLRRTIAGWNSGLGPLLWIVLLILSVAWRRWRPVLAEGLLGVALIAATAWLVAPNYPLTLDGIFSNDMLFWGIVMIIVSGGAVALAQRQPEPSADPLCSTCAYNLTGNVSGTCPECGTPIPEDVRARITSLVP